MDVDCGILDVSCVTLVSCNRYVDEGDWLGYGAGKDRLLGKTDCNRLVGSGITGGDEVVDDRDSAGDGISQLVARVRRSEDKKGSSYNNSSSHLVALAVRFLSYA